jgi:hypothetical protein
MVTGPGFGRDSMTTGPATLRLLQHRLFFEDFSQDSAGSFSVGPNSWTPTTFLQLSRMIRARDLLIRLERECLAEQEYHRLPLLVQSTFLVPVGNQIYRRV